MARGCAGVLPASNRFRLIALLLFGVALLILVDQAHSADYAVTIKRLNTAGSLCWKMDGDTGEQWAWIFEVSTGTKKCFFRTDKTDNNYNEYLNWDLNFSTTKSSVSLGIEAYQKEGDGDGCTFEGSDNQDQYVTDTQTLSLSSLTVGQERSWSFSKKLPTDDECYMEASGTYQMLPSEALPGQPRIATAAITISNQKLLLSITGRELNPDPQESPVVQIFGPAMSCIASTFAATSTQITCTLTNPESDRISNMDTQVQVQTTYGVSRTATVSFPKCSPACQNNGTCWWSESIGDVECVCADYTYYGSVCQYKYPDGVPILQAVSPIGGDYTQDIVIAVSGRAFPEPADPSITDVICELSWSGPNQRLAPSGDHIETVRDVVWSGKLLPYDNRPIAQADSLQLRGLCVMPAGTFSRPTPDKRQAMVTLIWKRAANGESIESQDSRAFLLYGPFDPDSSSVQVVPNKADGEMRVFRDQTLRVTLFDADGNNRVGGQDSDIFALSWRDGPTSEPRFGIKGGVTKAFKYSECRRNPDNPTCAYYELTMSFDFSGKFKANVLTTNPSTLALVNINKGELVFDVKGFGDAVLPVPSSQPSSIAWAESLKDRSSIPIFDRNLAQLISPNTGARDKANVLGPLFQRWKGGWFTQRQTVSLAFESALSQATFGSVHVIRSQGTDDNDFCDDHTDELEGGELAKRVAPWENIGNVPGSFPLTGLGFSDGDCATSIVLNVVLLHRNPNSVGLTLRRHGMPNTNPRAKNTTIDVVLKVANESSAPIAAGVPSPVVLQYSSVEVPGLAALKGMPALADWVLTVTGPSDRGHIKDWYLDIQSEYCLTSTVVDNSICGDGGGQFYARASNVEDVVRLECPQGGVISEILWARFGKLDGSCEKDDIKVYDDCEANTAIVKQRVASVCVGHTSCELAALDTQFAEEIGEPYLCPGELPPCPEDTSLVTSEDSSSTQSKRKRDHHAREHKRPLAYPGTEDYYYKKNYVRHVTEPFFRPRRASDAPTCTYSAVRPKKALMVKAMCQDSNAVFKSTDSPPVEKKMLMTSVSADFDNDWKDETVTLYGYEGGALHASITFIENNKPKTAVYKNIVIGDSAVVLGGQIEMQTGDFDRDGYPELVFGFIDGTTGELKLYLWDLAINDDAIWRDAAKKSRSDLQACGCYETTTTITSLFANAIEITMPTAPAFPLAAGGERLDTKGFSYSLSAGDIGMYGVDFLVVAWIVDDNTVAWSLYLLNNDGGLSPVASEPTLLRSLRRPHAVSVNLANYEGTGFAELALGLVDDSEVRVYLYGIDQNEDGYPMTQAKVITVHPSTGEALWGADAQFAQRINLHMVSGDLDDDGDAEIVVAYTTGGMAHVHRIDAPGSGTKCRRLDCMVVFNRFDYALSLGAGGTGAPARSPELRVAIGNLDDSYANELILAVEYKSTIDATVSKIMLTSLTAQPNADVPFSINGRHCYKGPFYQEGEENEMATVNNMALTVGNLYGLGFRVGQPITVRFEGVPELVAVVNAPPTHYDVLEETGEEVIVNSQTFHGAGSFSQLSNIEGIVSTFEITRETASATTSSHGFQLNAKIAVVLGNMDFVWQKFKESSTNWGTAHMEQIAVAREMVASGDDSVLYISTDKDLWKYPVVDQSGNQVGSLDIWLSSSCGERCVQKGDGRDLWWYTPDHEPFNLLTYSTRAPTDFNPVNRIMVGEKVTLGPNAHEQWVDQQSGKSQNQVSITHSADRNGGGGTAGINIQTDAIFSSAFLGLGLQNTLPIGVSVTAGYAGRTEGSDEKMNSSLQSAAINRDASVHCYLEAIAPQYAYRVQPYVWMAKTLEGDEYLKVDYSAEPGYYPGVSTWWQRTYNKPDPAFNLPWWWTTFKRDRTMLTKEITAIPPFPKVGETVQVTVTVRNKALVQASDVNVALYRGSPDNCLDISCLFEGRTLISMTKVNIIPAQDQRDVTFLFKYDGVNNIHATIDDNDDIAEMHENNNQAYNLMFRNLRDEGYTLQTIRLDSTISVKPVKGGTGKKYTQGYDVSVTVLGDTFTRQNVLVQLWHGSVGGSGRLISTINVPRIRGSVTSTSRYTLSSYWDTRNTALYGQQELHAVILHSGFDTTPDNIISHVSQEVTVACFGDVDVCGVCGGDNSMCAGCDGVPLSGKTVDICGKCGGDGSTCCVRRPSQASVQYIRLGEDESLSKRIKVGDMVVWENMLDWNVAITGGVYDYVGAPSFELETLKQHGYDIQGQAPPMTLDDETVNAFVQKYLSMVVMKDHAETGSSDSPTPDTTTKYLRSVRSSTASAMTSDSDDLGLSRFPGWHVDSPTRRVMESRLRNIRETRKERYVDEYGYEDDVYEAVDDYEEDDDEMLVEEFYMNGICCAEEEDDQIARSAESRQRGRAAGSSDQLEHQRQLAQILSNSRTTRSARGVASVAPAKQSKRDAHVEPAFSLRRLAFAMLKHQKQQLDHINSIEVSLENNATLAQRRREVTARSFYDAGAHEAELLAESDPDSVDDASLGKIRCLCPNSRRRRAEGTGSSSSPPATPPSDPAEAGGTGSTPEPEGATKEGEKKEGEKKEDDKVENDGELGGAEVGTGAGMQMTTSYGVPTFSGFGAARGWALFDFAEIAKTAGVDPNVMAPGAASAPHRFFSPGIYVWHDSNNPALHGTIIVDPSDLQVDVCNVCGGNGTTCLDCKGTPFGKARRDSCGVCYDPFVDTYDPSKATDCAGVCNGSAKIDACGYCTGGSTGLVAEFARDCMGKCNGSTPAFCGVCGATEDTHGYLADCAGECGGVRKLNPCGYCVGGDTKLDATYGMDCTGTCNGTAVRDCNGVCEGTTKIDCAGVCGGSAKINKCLRCVGGNTTLDDAMTKTCAGICAIKESEVCGYNATAPAKRFDYADQEDDQDTSASDGGLVMRACDGVVDKRGTCCAADKLDCSNLCYGSATEECGVCVGGSSGRDVSQFKDCMGVCNGTAKYNPCGVCATPANYYNGSNYRVDCSNTCNGSAYIDDCGVCSEGSTGVSPNLNKDCRGVCYGNATTDDCGVCYLPGGGHTPNSDKDCAGVCNGTAVRDDCNQCVLGTTKREFNADKDCAGQCFGQHVVTDPACSCPAGKLDQCFVCGGNNTQCAGCDGMPWSGKRADYCGVCGGNNTACCFLPFAQTTITIRDFEAIVLRNTLETGETLAITNLHAGYSYTVIMYRLDVPADIARVKQIQTRWDYAALRPGNTLNIVIQDPGLYRLTTVESSSVTFELTVTYNSKKADVCGRCVYTDAKGSASSSGNNATQLHQADLAEYDHCCATMPTNNVHDWFETTFYYELIRPEHTTRVVPHTGHYRAQAATHLVRLIEPQMIDGSTWWQGKRLAVGDVLVLENRDVLDHVISFSGPQPVPDVLLERGTTVSTPPFLKPGTYRLLSNRNLINTTFTVEFDFVCSVYAAEPQVQDDDHTLLIVLTTTLGGSFLVLVVLALLIAGAAVAIWMFKRPNVETHSSTVMYPL